MSNTEKKAFPLKNINKLPMWDAELVYRIRFSLQSAKRQGYTHAQYHNDKGEMYLERTIDEAIKHMQPMHLDSLPSLDF